MLLKTPFRNYRFELASAGTRQEWITTLTAEVPHCCRRRHPRRSADHCKHCHRVCAPRHVQLRVHPQARVHPGLLPCCRARARRADRLGRCGAASPMGPCCRCASTLLHGTKQRTQPRGWCPRRAHVSPTPCPSPAYSYRQCSTRSRAAAMPAGAVHHPGHVARRRRGAARHTRGLLRHPQLLQAVRTCDRVAADIDAPQRCACTERRLRGESAPPSARAHGLRIHAQQVHRAWLRDRGAGWRLRQTGKLSSSSPSGCCLSGAAAVRDQLVCASHLPAVRQQQRQRAAAPDHCCSLHRPVRLDVLVSARSFAQRATRPDRAVRDCQHGSARPARHTVDHDGTAHAARRRRTSRRCSHHRLHFGPSGHDGVLRGWAGRGGAAAARPPAPRSVSAIHCFAHSRRCSPRCRRSRHGCRKLLRSRRRRSRAPGTARPLIAPQLPPKPAELATTNAPPLPPRLAAADPIAGQSSPLPPPKPELLFDFSALRAMLWRRSLC